jgi:hypothetical protein
MDPFPTSCYQVHVSFLTILLTFFFYISKGNSFDAQGRNPNT